MGVAKYFLLSAVIVGVVAIVRFQHPGLTETELFLRYWWLWVGATAAALFIVWRSK